MKKLAGINLKKPPLEVKHSDLILAGDSPYKKKCPACNEGVLLMQRMHIQPYYLLPYDYCILCGQAFIYTDIELKTLFL